MVGMTLALGSIDDIFVLDGLERFPCERESASVPQDLTLVLRGWAADPFLLRPASRIALIVDGVFYGAVRKFRERHDVADHFGTNDMLRTGFVAVFNARDLPLGAYELRVVLDDGRSSLPAIHVRVALPARVPDESPSVGFAFSIESCDDTVATPRIARFQHGSPGIARGIANLRASEMFGEAYALVDECDAYPVQLYGTDARGDAPAESHATRFLIGFNTTDLELGTHTLQLSIRPGDGSATRHSSPIDFEIVPLCLERFVPMLASPIVPASVEWATAETHMERVTGLSRTFARGEIACVRGWALDVICADSPSSVILRFEDGLRFRMETRGERSDVARALAMPGATYCGFVGSISTASLRSGANLARCYLIAKDGSNAYETDATIELVVIG